MKDSFRRFARIAADGVGSPAAFLLGVIATVAWAASGSYFHYSDTWQLVINTLTSIGTFLIVFLIQNTQNRDAKVMQLKLDELIRAVKPARTELVQMESLSDAELEALQQDFQSCRDEASGNLERVAESRRNRIRPVASRQTEGPYGRQEEASEYQQDDLERSVALAVSRALQIGIKGARMRFIFLVVFIVLLVTWLLAWVTFHVAGGLIHFLLIAAVVSLVLHLISGRRSA